MRRRSLPGGTTRKLRNRAYVGELFHKGGYHPGEHRPILDLQLFSEDQVMLDRQRSGKTRSVHRMAALLLGKVEDSRGHPMIPTPTNKKSIIYRYYQSKALIDGRTLHRPAGQIPPRFRLSDAQMIGQSDRAMGIPKRDLQKQLYQGWRALGCKVERGRHFPPYASFAPAIKRCFVVAAAMTNDALDPAAMARGEFNDAARAFSRNGACRLIK